jgi:hypothetical protein
VGVYQESDYRRLRASHPLNSLDASERVASHDLIVLNLVPFHNRNEAKVASKTNEFVMFSDRASDVNLLEVLIPPREFTKNFVLQGGRCRHLPNRLNVELEPLKVLPSEGLTTKGFEVSENEIKCFRCFHNASYLINNYYTEFSSSKANRNDPHCHEIIETSRI